MFLEVLICLCLLLYDVFHLLKLGSKIGVAGFQYFLDFLQFEDFKSGVAVTGFRGLRQREWQT